MAERFCNSNACRPISRVTEEGCRDADENDRFYTDADLSVAIFARLVGVFALPIHEMNHHASEEHVNHSDPHDIQIPTKPGKVASTETG